MSETRIVDIIAFVDKSSRVINLKIRLRMTQLYNLGFDILQTNQMHYIIVVV